MTLENDNTVATLATLPPEILALIVTHIETARALSRLSLTCKRVHSFVENDGFRIFSQTRFPYAQFSSAHAPSFWKAAAHGLTTLSRNLDRKAFVAWEITPSFHTRQDGRTQRRGGTYRSPRQSMGFVPVIDSYEAWYDGDWTSRKEVVAWGAGADLVIRSKTMGAKAKAVWDSSVDGSPRDFDAHQHKYEWANYHETGVREGHDDITYLHLMPNNSLDDPEQVIIGRANGGLAQVSLQKGTSHSNVQCSFNTRGRPVKSATTNLSNQGLLATCLSVSTIALYPLVSTNRDVAPIAETSVTPSAQSGRTWTSRFLGHDQLVIGLGPSLQPIRVYNIGHDELKSEHVRSLEFNDAIADEKSHIPSSGGVVATSVYSLAPIAASSLAGGSPSNLFLSGAYDGLSRLHDLRSPKPTIASFRDLVDTFSPIYSLLAIGSEHFIAGGARHSIIKVFDLRMPGGKLYHSTDLDPCSVSMHDVPRQSSRREPAACCDYHFEAKHGRYNWNIFLETGAKRYDTPVYTLSRPSHCSPSLFVGTENMITQLNIISIMDRHPDAVFNCGSITTGKKCTGQEIIRKWDPQKEVACLPMYEHNTGPITLLRQKEVGFLESTVNGWDERWSYHHSFR